MRFREFAIEQLSTKQLLKVKEQIKEKFKETKNVEYALAYNTVSYELIKRGAIK